MNVFMQEFDTKYFLKRAKGSAASLQKMIVYRLHIFLPSIHIL